ncbi:hypothetical protein [Derxia gummosa]|uniref:Uncharacterized protein n=1 Tax=Derxia gummosa DSM 723 TaxID=1121388 RepID=A0A8B6X1W2_9BURK|nr:hypothetical protein [Derxia gummosa]
MPVHIGEFELTPAPSQAATRSTVSDESGAPASASTPPEPPAPATLQQADERRRERALRSYAH